VKSVVPFLPPWKRPACQVRVPTAKAPVSNGLAALRSAEVARLLQRQGEPTDLAHRPADLAR